MSISLSDIKYFLKAQEEGNMSRAANLLGLRQSTISGAILRIEDELKIRLFVRSKNGVKLTRDGEVFLPSAIALLDSWESLKFKTSTPGAVNGRIIIGCHSVPACFFFPKIFSVLKKEFPQLEVRYLDADSITLNDLVQRGEVDFAIVSTALSRQNHVVTPLHPEIVGFYGLDHRATPHETLLFTVPGFSYAEELLNQLKKKKIVFKEIIQLSNFQVCASMTQAGLGASILPESLISPSLKLLTNLPSIEGRHYLIYDSDRQQSISSRLIVKLLKSRLKHQA